MRQKLLTALLALGILAVVTGLGTRAATATTAGSESMSAESPVSSDAEQSSESSGAGQSSGEEASGEEAPDSEPVTEPAPDSGSEDQGSGSEPSARPSPGPTPDSDADQGSRAGDGRPGRGDRDARGAGRGQNRPGESRSAGGNEGGGSTGGRDSDKGDSSESSEEEADDGERKSGDDLLEDVFSPPPVAVPNAVIDSFEIPPFLVPIYQACGTQYGIPWQLLAAINKIETAFGTNLSVSSAGALGWMQFMPGTWAMYGTDANGDRRRDPYNPVDAICSAARYLSAAGGAERLRDAIFAYNHANWYVEDVLELAQGYSRLPADLIASLTGLTEGAHFPVAANARYANQVTIRKLAGEAGEGGRSGAVASTPGSATERRAVTIFSRPNAPAVAVNDGVIEAIGKSERFGGYVVLRDAFGNRFTYWGLGGVSRVHPVPKRDHLTAEDFEMVTPDGDRMPRKPASRSDEPAESGLDPESIAASPESATASNRASRNEARRTTRWAERVARRSAAQRGDHEHAASGDGDAGRQEASDDARDSDSRSNRSGDEQADAEPVNTENARERLFARPNRPNNVDRAIVTGQIGHPVAGNERLQLFRGSVASIVRHDPECFKLERLREGSRVVAGTVLGRASNDGSSGSVRFAIRPAGDDAPYIDPTPILDGWRLLAATDIYRAKRSNPFFTGIGVSQVLMLPKAALIKRILNDPRLEIYSCGREDVASGQIDRRVLAVLAYLAERGFRLTVTSLRCGRSGIYTSSGNISNHVGGRAVDIAAINGKPILGNQGPGSLTEAVVLATLRLQGIMLPSELISLHDMGGPSFAMADHADHIHIGYPSPGGESSPSDTPRQVLRPGQWTRLMDQLGRIENPSVPLQPSGAATPATGDDPDAVGSGQ